VEDLLDQVLDFLFSANGGIAAPAAGGTAWWIRSMRSVGGLSEAGGRRCRKRLQPPGLRSRPWSPIESDPVTKPGAPSNPCWRSCAKLAGFRAPNWLLKPPSTTAGEPRPARMAFKCAQGWPKPQRGTAAADVLSDPGRIRSEAGLTPATSF